MEKNEKKWKVPESQNPRRIFLRIHTFPGRTLRTAVIVRYPYFWYGN